MLFWIHLKQIKKFTYTHRTIPFCCQIRIIAFVKQYFLFNSFIEVLWNELFVQYFGRRMSRFSRKRLYSLPKILASPLTHTGKQFDKIGRRIFLNITSCCLKSVHPPNYAVISAEATFLLEYNTSTLKGIVGSKYSLFTWNENRILFRIRLKPINNFTYTQRIITFFVKQDLLPLLDNIFCSILFIEVL